MDTFHVKKLLRQPKAVDQFNILEFIFVATVSAMLVARGEESSTRATISSLMALITKSSRSTGRHTVEHTDEH
ncbi:hypothetical protein EYF80_023364 [Liparis tanakae]|uniref:Uncharacterized protein n=1 Tax=Liparis tanakae TaxID=230148 RepID=A0A4Z2HKY3_9TELE|nr:hypothetical protein EYF80_023364 [Liparis tanakae]